MNRLRLVASEAIRSLGANLSTTFAATTTVLIGMFLLGLLVALGTWIVSWSDHVKRQLEVPANMFLESVRPLNFLGSQALVFLQPILGMVLNPAEVEKFAKLLEKRNALPRLIEKIEEGASKR